MAINNSSARLMIDDLTGYNLSMTEWENGFIQSMDEYDEDDGWTEDQRAKIEEIWSKYVGA